MQLTTPDFLLIGIYFVVLIIIGYLSSRKQNEEDYLIAERKLGPWSTMATINASKTGSVLMIFVALVYLWGFSALWYFIGMTLGVLVFLPFALKLKSESQGRYYTLADYFKYNYGKKIAKLVSVLTIFLMFGFLIMNLMAGTKIFVFFSGWPFWICAIIMISIVLVYMLMGGFKAVVKTDNLQYAAMIIILALMAFMLFSGSLIPASEWNFFRADIGTMVGFFLVGILFPFAMPEMWQRVYASKNRKSLKKGLLLSALVYFIFSFLLALVAITIKVKFPGVDPDLALIHGFANLLPTGLLGLAAVLLFAAIMSSIDTYIFTAASSTIQDWFDWDKKTTIKNLKKSILILGVAATLISILLQDLVLSTYLVMAFLLVLAVIIIATWIKKSVKPLTLYIGAIVGIVSISFLIIYSLFFGEGITPTLVIVGLATTILGILIGGLVSFLRK